MVFTVTSSDCKVKKARFYEFLFTLGWRLIKNKSLYKFPAPKHVSFRKYSNLNLRVFTVRDTKTGMLSHWKKSLRLIFSSLTISSIKRCVYVHVCWLSSEKEELLWKKWTPNVFVDFRRSYWWTVSVHQYGVAIQSSTKMHEMFLQITQKRWATETWDLNKLFIY